MLYLIDDNFSPRNSRGEIESDNSFKLYTIQLHERNIDGFEIEFDENNAVIFKKTQAERLIFRNMAKEDCNFTILKPSLKKYILGDMILFKMYTKAFKYYKKGLLDRAESEIEELLAMVRTRFLPPLYLKQLISEKRKSGGGASKSPASSKIKTPIVVAPPN